MFPAALVKILKRYTILIGKNIIRMILLLTAVSIVSFALMTMSPVDPLQANVGQAALGSMSQEQIEKLESYWGVDEPPVKRYLSWAKDFIHGDFGMSLQYRQPVSKVIAVKLGNSLFLMVTAWVLSGVIGFALGILAGVFRGRLPDRMIKGYCVIISSTPAFWLALLLLMIFGVWLKVLPIGLSVPIGLEASGVTFLDRLRHAILPALTLSITGISNIALHTREKMIDVMESDYVLFARARGESTWQIVQRHALRNVLLPAITLQFASISEIFGGSVLVEQVFSYAGMGQAAVTAGLGSDMPLLMAITIVSAMFVFGGNLIANILYGVVDPRIRRGGSAK
ncbi:MAG: ABC transporter permease [Lachnospiraceae bacterium]|nr:ABC transporter permease [Lachnospiraceae bacterium]